MRMFITHYNCFDLSSMDLSQVEYLRTGLGVSVGVSVSLQVITKCI